jgi:hypothetical protein
VLIAGRKAMDAFDAVPFRLCDFSAFANAMTSDLAPLDVLGTNTHACVQIVALEDIMRRELDECDDHNPGVRETMNNFVAIEVCFHEMAWRSLAAER